MTGENNKKGCNNKILISTWMLVSMVCMLSVSDMLGMMPQVTQIDPCEAMEKINKNPNYYTEFMKIFKDDKNLIKRNCFCCGGIDIEHTKLPKDIGNAVEAVPCTIYGYIMYRFEIKNGNAKVVDIWNVGNGTCEAFDNLILEIYKAPSTS